MRTKYRLQLERASRVLVFCRERPATEAAEQAAIASLTERLAHAENDVHDGKGRTLAVKAAVTERRALRRRIHAQIRLLTAIARTAGEESIGTPIVIAFPQPRVGQVDFLTGARLAVATAREREELLARYGLPAGHLDALSANLGVFASLLDQRDQATLDRRAAHRDLGRTVRELGVVLRQLDAIMTYRYREQPAQLAAWASAIDWRIGPRSPAGPETAAPRQLPPGTEPGLVA